MDGRRRRWFSLSALYPHGETAGRIQAEFGRDGLLVWVLYLAACKRSPGQGTFSYTSEESGWAELGLLDPDDRPGFSLADFWRFTGRLKQTRQTRTGRITHVTATHWKEWQDASSRSLEADRKARKRAENRPDTVRPDSDRDHDSDKDHGQEPAQPPAAGPSSSLDEDPVEPGEPAAAEQPTLPEIREVVERMRGADAGSTRMVERDAVGLSRQVFFEEVDRVRSRCRTGDVANPIGLLRRLLRIRSAELVAAASAQLLADSPPAHRPSPRQLDQVLRDAPGLYVRQMAPVADDDELRARLCDHHDGDRIDELLSLASDVREGRIAAADPETPEQARRRWVTDKAHDSSFSLDEIHLVVDGWERHDFDDIERAELHELADHLRQELTARAAA